MANSINLYLNGIGNNLFVPQTTINTEEEETPTVNDTSDSSYNPIIETSQDEEGAVEIDTNKDNDKDKDKDENYINNMVKGTGTIIGGTIDATAGVVGDSVKSVWKMAPAFGQVFVGGGQVALTPVVGLFNGIKSTFSNTAKGIGQIFSGRIFSGIGSITKGVFSIVTEPAKWAWNGVKKVAKGVGKVAKAGVNAVKSVGKAVVNGVKNVGKAIGKGIKKIFKGW